MPAMLIVDDRQLLRSTDCRLLDVEEFKVVGNAADGASAVSNGHPLHPTSRSSTCGARTGGVLEAGRPPCGQA
jgi:hypothetical protein